jgi:hypothetical protein
MTEATLAGRLPTVVVLTPIEAKLKADPDDPR